MTKTHHGLLATSMKSLLALLIPLILTPATAAETQFKDSEGQTAYLYTPTEKPVDGKTYWLAIGAHGAGGDGKGAGGIADWAKDDVIVLGPSFVQRKPDPDAPKADGPPMDSYQMAGASHVEKLKALIAQVGKTWKVHPKVFLHGFSAGAQFVHRFAMNEPELVAGVCAASAGSWSTRGFGEINPAASHIPFALSCGEYDRDKSTPKSPLSRVDWMKEFAAELKKASFDVEARVIENNGHQQHEEALALSASCFARARGLNFSRTALIALDFNRMNPVWGLAAEATEAAPGHGVTAVAKWDATGGVVEQEGTAVRTGAIRLEVNSGAGTPDWSGSMRTDPLPVHCAEADVKLLTLSCDLWVSMARPVQVTIESFDAARKRTGGLVGVLYPAAPGFYHRHAMDLGTMKATGDGTFQPKDPLVQISYRIGADLGWPAAAGHQVRVDNLSYAAPALFVSPAGDDKNDGRSADKPLATVQKAVDRAQAGDVVMVMDGTYTSDKSIAHIRGTGAPAAWLVLRAHPGQQPVFRSTWWDCIKIGQGNKSTPSTAPATAYVELRGLTVQGYSADVEQKFKDKIGKPAPETNGNGISSDGRFQKDRPHHLRIADCTVFDCAGGGITAIRTDRISIENNVTRNNCRWMIYAGSGISILEASCFENTPGEYRLLLRNNSTHDNACTQPWSNTGKLSDGNGLIIDTLRGLPADPLSAYYHGRTLVQGNVSYRNGGSGMHAFASNHVDFINNTCVGNNTVMDYSQLGITRCADCRVLNNICVAPADKPVNRMNGNSHDILISHNLLWGGNGQSVPGEHAIIADPQFSDAAKDDFHLGKESPARAAAGMWEIAPVIDAEGHERSMSTLDIGALGQ